MFFSNFLLAATFYCIVHCSR